MFLLLKEENGSLLTAKLDLQRSTGFGVNDIMFLTLMKFQSTCLQIVNQSEKQKCHSDKL